MKIRRVDDTENGGVVLFFCKGIRVEFDPLSPDRIYVDDRNIDVLPLQGAKLLCEAISLAIKEAEKYVLTQP